MVTKLIENHMQDHPAFIIHNLEHGLSVAQEATQTKSSAVLFSPLGAAKSLGPDVFISMINSVFELYPEADIIGVLDCANDAGNALGAIRRGASHISVQLDAPEYEKILDIAAKSNVSVRVFPDNALDLIKFENFKQHIISHLMEHKQ
jgi:fructose/tagatose bisphosphate aldolase